MPTNTHKAYTIVLLLIFIATLLLAGCSPAIAISHQDPTYPSVSIAIDGTQEKELSYGDEKSFSVSQGVHYVNIFPSGTKECPWTADGKGWEIWVDQEAKLVLLPPKK